MWGAVAGFEWGAGRADPEGPVEHPDLLTVATGRVQAKQRRTVAKMRPFLPPHLGPRAPRAARRAHPMGRLRGLLIALRRLLRVGRLLRAVAVAARRRRAVGVAAVHGYAGASMYF